MSRTAQAVLVLVAAVAAAVAVVLVDPTSGTFSRVPLLALIAVVAVVLLLVMLVVSRRGDASAPGERADGLIDITEPADMTASDPGLTGATAPGRSVVYKVVLHDSPREERRHGDAWMMWAADMLEAPADREAPADAGSPTNDAGPQD